MTTDYDKAVEEAAEDIDNKVHVQFEDLDTVKAIIREYLDPVMQDKSIEATMFKTTCEIYVKKLDALTTELAKLKAMVREYQGGIDLDPSLDWEVPHQRQCRRCHQPAPKPSTKCQNPKCIAVRLRKASDE